MNQWILNFQWLWDYKLGPMLPTVVPALLVLMGLIWFFAVYLRGKFSFTPALAIARVTIQDSIGRMEVVILLVIGMLIVGINGLIPNTPQGSDIMKKYMESPFLQEKLKEYHGRTDLTVYRETGTEGEPVFRGELNLSGVEDESGSGVSSTVEDEIPDIEPESKEPVNSEGLTAEEQSMREQAYMVQKMIWNAAFLMADFFVALIGFVLAMVVLPNEMNRGVVLSILPKPISREEYVFGKALGIWAIVAGCFLMLTVELFSIQAIFNMLEGRHPVNWNLVKAMCLFPFKYATLVLVIMGMTMRFPELPAAILGLGIYMAGHFHEKVYEIASENMPLIFAIPLKFTYYILPHLSQVTFLILDTDQSLLTSWKQLWGWVWQISIYNILLLWLLSFLFRRKSL